MSIFRQDAWTQDEDLLLAEVVLRHIREGSTQLRAFEDVGQQLTRTSAACGFRWNSYVRKQYQSGIELAKKQRKENKKNPQEEEPAEIVIMAAGIVEAGPEMKKEVKKERVQLKEVIDFLQQFEEMSELIVTEKNTLMNKLQDMMNEVQFLKKENESLRENLGAVEEDYRSLLQIMERARKMSVLEENSNVEKVKFQMDKNGNLERVLK